MVDLKEMAEKIAPIYAENPKVDAVLLGGSVSRGWQDQFSDIELLISGIGIYLKATGKSPSGN